MRSPSVAVLLVGVSCATRTKSSAYPASVRSTSPLSTQSHAPVSTAQPSLRPSAAVASGPAPAPIDDDDVTALNARQWKYYPFFKRLRQTVCAAWEPSNVWNALPAAERTSLGTATLETVLNVELSAEGAITKIGIRTSSGISELDAEAIRAFQVSSPFGATPDHQPLSTFGFFFDFDVGPATSSREFCDI